MGRIRDLLLLTTAAHHARATQQNPKILAQHPSCPAASPCLPDLHSHPRALRAGRTRPPTSLPHRARRAVARLRARLPADAASRPRAQAAAEPPRDSAAGGPGRCRSRTCSTSPARSRRRARRCWPTQRRRSATRRPWRACAQPAARGRPHQHERVRVLRRRHQPAPRHAGQSVRHGTPRASRAARPRARRSRWRPARPSSALGSDTGGSIRIPAALCGIVGFKNTARLTPLQGAFPLSTTLDTVCAMTRSRARRDRWPTRSWRRASVARSDDARCPATGWPWRTRRCWTGSTPPVARAFERSAAARCATPARESRRSSWRRSSDLGTHPGHRRLRGRRELCLAPPAAGSARRRLRPARARCASSAAPRMKACEYIDLQPRARAPGSPQSSTALRGFDAVLSPTVPIVAPPIARGRAGRRARRRRSSASTRCCCATPAS